jgi:hypothetical protein
MRLKTPRHGPNPAAWPGDPPTVEDTPMRVLPALALAGALMLGACTNPDGSLNVPGTLALGAGAAIAGLAIASANDRPRHTHHHYDRQPRPHRGWGYGPPPRYAGGYGYPRHRRW